MSAAVKPHPAPLASTQDSRDVSICEIDGRCDAQHADLLQPTSGADTHDVKRLGLAEVRIGVFHIYSYAGSDGYSEACEKWLHFVANCVEHQVDFLSCNANLFAQRSFKKDDHSDFRTCIMIDILERFLQEINLHRSPLNRISYNIIVDSSTQASQYLRSMEGESADCDSMLLISLFYGKETVISEEKGKEESASADGVAGPAVGDEIVLTDVEQLKYLLTYDLGLKETDAAWHSPLMLKFVRSKICAFAPKIPNIEEGPKFEDLNVGYKERREERKAERRERHDSVPPLRKDSFRNVDSGARRRSRSMSRTPGRDRAEVRPPRTPPQPLPVKAPPVQLRRQPSTPPQPPPVKAPPVPPPRPARSPSVQRPVPSRSLGTSGTTPPWREHEERRNCVGRERSTPQGRNTRTRTETRSSAGGHWTNTGRSQRERSINVPEPPPPPTRMSGTQWLNSGYPIIPLCQNRHHLRRRTALAVQVIFNRHIGVPIRKLTWLSTRKVTMLHTTDGCCVQMEYG